MPEPLAADYDIFKRKIQRITGLDLDAYKQDQMERRLRSFMERAGASTFQQYYRMLEDDKMMLQQFMDRVTINVSELFRNPEQFKSLQDRIIPDLLSRSKALRVWSAGCSYGQEPYSLAICLEEASLRKGHSITATDIDIKALEHAKRGVFSLADGKNVDAGRRDRWFKLVDGMLEADKRLKEMIEFKRTDLLRDPCPQGMDLVVCRNVVIYFTEVAKAKLYRNFYQALKPGGYLFVGGTERVNGYAEIGYLNPSPFFYQKPLSE